MQMSVGRHDQSGLASSTTPLATTRHRRHRWLSRLGGIAAVGVVATVAGCGGSDSGSAERVADVTTTPPAAAATTVSSDPEASQAAWEDCLRSHAIEGLEIVSGGMSFSASDDDAAMAAFEAAQADCDALLPDAGGDLELDPGAVAEQREEALAFAQCMRDNDVDFPDPVFDDKGGMSQTIDGDIDGDAFAEAARACGGSGGVFIGDGAPGIGFEQNSP